MPKITYDPDVKILNIRIDKGKIVNSEMFSDCILDYDRNGNVTNVEILEIEPADIRNLGSSMKGTETNIEKEEDKL